jgi:hypothetical protein
MAKVLTIEKYLENLEKLLVLEPQVKKGGLRRRNKQKGGGTIFDSKLVYLKFLLKLKKDKKNKVSPSEIVVVPPDSPKDPEDPEKQFVESFVYSISPQGTTNYMENAVFPFKNVQNSNGAENACRQALNVVFNNNNMHNAEARRLANLLSKRFQNRNTTRVAQTPMTKETKIKLLKIKVLVGYVRDFARVAFRSPLEKHLYIEIYETKLYIICSAANPNISKDKRQVKFSLDEGKHFYYMTETTPWVNEPSDLAEDLNHLEKPLLDQPAENEPQLFRFHTCITTHNNTELDFFIINLTLSNGQARICTVIRNLDDIITSLRYIKHNNQLEKAHYSSSTKARRRYYRGYNEIYHIRDQHEQLREININPKKEEFDSIDQIPHGGLLNAHVEYLERFTSEDSQVFKYVVEDQFLLYLNKLEDHQSPYQHMYTAMFGGWLKNAIDAEYIRQPGIVTEYNKKNDYIQAVKTIYDNNGYGMTLPHWEYISVPKPFTYILVVPHYWTMIQELFPVILKQKKDIDNFIKDKKEYLYITFPERQGLDVVYPDLHYKLNDTTETETLSLKNDEYIEVKARRDLKDPLTNVDDQNYCLLQVYKLTKNYENSALNIIKLLNQFKKLNEHTNYQTRKNSIDTLIQDLIEKKLCYFPFTSS